MAHGEGHKAHNHHRSSERRYDRYITTIDHKPIGCRRLFCATPDCGQQGEILDRTPNGLVPKVIEQRFSQKGWAVGANEKHDFCPTCVEAQRVARRSARVKPLPTNVVSILSTPAKPTLHPPQQETAMQTAPTAELPEQMSRDSRRTIFAKLQDVYIDEAKGYATPWTDQAVAKDLGCPLAWVIAIREENFGPVSDNSEIRAMLSRVEVGAREAKALLDDVKVFRKELTEHIEKGNALMKRATEIGKNLDGLLATADRISQSVRP